MCSTVTCALQGNNPKVSDYAKSLVNESLAVNVFIQDKLSFLSLCPQHLDLSSLKSASCIRLLADKLVSYTFDFSNLVLLSLKDVKMPPSSASSIMSSLAGMHAPVYSSLFV